MKKKLIYILVPVLLAMTSFSIGVVANDNIMTLVGKNELETYNLATPGKRIDTVYQQGNDKIFIQCSDVQLIPVGDGDSMSPMVTKGHLILITTDYEFSDIQIGDFIVVEGLNGRYFHQVVEVKENSLTTRGINNTENDIFPVFEEDVVGVAIAVIW